MLFLKGFEDDGDQLNVAVPDLVRHLVCRVAPVPPANASSLLRLHVVLQLPVGGVNLLEKLRPAVLNNASATAVAVLITNTLGAVLFAHALCRQVD